MEEHKTRNKFLNSIIAPFLKSSNFNPQSNAYLSLENKIQKLLKNLKNSGGSIDDTLSDGFFDIYHTLKITEKPTPLKWRQFILSFQDLLAKIDNLKVENIINSISMCRKQIENLENTTNIEYVKTWFADFCKNICSSLIKLHARAQEICSDTTRDFIFVHIVQLSTSLQLLLKLFAQELVNKILIVESRRFIIKRFCFYFDEICEIMKQDLDEDPKHNFIFWMDRALDLIGAIEPNTHAEKKIGCVKPAIEEVLSYSMSIAQICTANDSKLAIKAGIQSVLHELNLLQVECKKHTLNPNLCNLYVDLVSDKLCILEHRVNTAVLKISLKVFSDIFEPLQNLLNTCEAVEVSILSRSENDIDTLITEFDLHVDSIMQVGLFAISCSTDKKIVSKMRGCLTSLEALESELVPALTTLYMEPSQVACLHASLFVEHWKSEVLKLRDAVYFIIDPSAFGQVVREDYKIKLENLQKHMSNGEAMISQSSIENVCKRVEVFIHVMKASLPELKLPEETLVLKHFKNLQDVHNEVCSASTIILKENDRKSSERVMKRCNILMTMMDRVIKSLSNDTTQEESEKSKESSRIKEKPEICVNTFVERGQQMLKDRSMLFRTPIKINKNKTVVLVTPGIRNTSKLYQSKNLGLSFARKLSIINCDETDINTSMDLQITDILEELTCLVDTLR